MVDCLSGVFGDEEANGAEDSLVFGAHVSPRAFGVNVTNLNEKDSLNLISCFKAFMEIESLLF